MKKYLLWICAATALLAAGTSCSDDPEVDSVGRVGLRQESLTADGAGEKLTLSVTSNAYWHIEFVDPTSGETIRWVSASETSGMGNADVTLDVARNRSTAARTTYVKVITDSDSASASILLTQSAGTVGGGDGYDFPICEMFEIDANHALNNAFIEGSKCYFDGGMILQRTGSAVSLTFEIPCHTNPKEDPWFQRGINAAPWADGDAWVFEIPVKEALFGDLRYSYGSRRDNAQNASSPWVFEWSADGETWTKFDGTCVGGSSDAVWKTIDFTIPENKKIPAGGKLWVRHTTTSGAGVGSSTNKSMTFQHGICITKAEAAKTTLPAMNNEKVVFAWGFDDVITAKAAYIDLPIGFLSSWNAGSYSLPKELADVVDVKECYTRPGFLQVGRGDEALITRYTQGSYTLKLATRFETMKIIKSDLKLTFSASAMVDAYGKPTDPSTFVKVDGSSGATVDNAGKIEGLANNEFKKFTVYVRNAKPETEITITSADMTGSTDDVRFFLDDILVEVEGEPQRPSVDDPVKATVAEIRAKKGPSAVTITDNLYIQGRVVAVDNVPAGCFAVQDADAGIFVKLANHSLAAGDMVDVTVKGAQLAADADGLLVVTPTAADKVSKGQVPAQIPEAKAISIADLKAGTYEAMLVSLPESQVVAADLSKTLSGNVTLELEDQLTTYIMKTYASASFAATAVPQKRGAVKGLAGTSFLLPTSAEDLAAMTGTRFGQTVYAITPIDGHFYPLGSAGNFTIGNATYAADSKSVTLTDGHAITKVGSATGDCLFGCYGTAKAPATNMYDARFYTTGWGGDNWQENGLVFKIKAASVIKGNLRFGFGWFGASGDNLPKNWKVMWSTDNTTWNSGVKVISIATGMTSVSSDDPGDEVFAFASSANAGGYRIAYFNLPENKSVAKGGYLYLKVAQADNECQRAGAVDPAKEMILINGFYLQTHERRAYHTSVLPSGEKVLLTEGFDNNLWGPDNFAYAWQSFASHKIAYEVPAGWEKAGSVFEQPGYVRIGGSGTDAASSLTTPALTALGDTPTDITVKFKAATLLVGAAGLVPDNRTIAVQASGTGTVGSEVYFPSTLSDTAASVDQATSDKMCDEYLRWYDCSV